MSGTWYGLRWNSKIKIFVHGHTYPYIWGWRLGPLWGMPTQLFCLICVLHWKWPPLNWWPNTLFEFSVLTSPPNKEFCIHWCRDDTTEIRKHKLIWDWWNQCTGFALRSSNNHHRWIAPTNCLHRCFMHSVRGLQVICLKR